MFVFSPVFLQMPWATVKETDHAVDRGLKNFRDLEQLLPWSCLLRGSVVFGLGLLGLRKSIQPYNPMDLPMELFEHPCASFFFPNSGYLGLLRMTVWCRFGSPLWFGPVGRGVAAMGKPQPLLRLGGDEAIPGPRSRAEEEVKLRLRERPVHRLRMRCCTLFEHCFNLSIIFLD